ncbi:hypothetical protein PR048_028408 [Dryococelus australis]|uniref:Uncharacterized protein n=1 Tax=Dryococelus australis TaxID=614101 RepID=A0ABQ9GAX4_9NEOP|nr:hypothetical protein PR048_028408 [Dryococelus australis]
MLERFLDMSRIASQLLLDAADSPEMNLQGRIMTHCTKSYVWLLPHTSGEEIFFLCRMCTELQNKLMAECNKRFDRI